MADTKLGNLVYQLSLDKKNFDEDVAKIKQSLKELVDNKTVQIEGLNQGIIKTIQKDIDAAEFKIKKIIVDPKATKESMQQQIDSIASELTARINLIINPMVGQDNGISEIKTLIEDLKETVKAENDRKKASKGANLELEEGKKKASEMAQALNRFSGGLETLSNNLKGIKPLIGEVFSAYTLKEFMGNLIDIGGEIQKQRMALGKILKNDSNANILFGEMKDLAVKSPFGLLDLMQNARQLSAFGVEYNKLYDTMSRLSDVAAGLGIQFGRLSLVYGETMERGFLDGKLVRQFSYMGLPILQKIAEYYNTINKAGDGKLFSASDVRKMVSNREVSFEDVDAVIKKMTDAEGQFANMQEVMAESVAGKWKNLHDAVDIMYSDIVEGNSALFKMPAEILTTLVKNYEAYTSVLLLVAGRLIGARAATALYNATLGKQVTTVYNSIKAEKAAEVQTKLRNATLSKASVLTRMRIAGEKQITAEYIKQVAAEKNLSDEEKVLLATKLSVNRQNSEYLMQCRLITASMNQQIMSSNPFVSAWGRVRGALAITGLQMKMLTSEFMAMSWAMLTNPMTWIFAAVGAVVELGMNIANVVSKEREMRDAMRDSMRNLRDDLEAISDDVTLNIDSNGKVRATSAEIQTAIKNLVTVIKNDVPGAKAILDEAFELDSSGNYKKGIEERYKFLKEKYDAYLAISKDEDTGAMFDKALSKKMTENWYNKYWTDDLLRDAKDFEKAYDKASDALVNFSKNANNAQKKIIDATRQNRNLKNNSDLFDSWINQQATQGNITYKGGYDFSLSHVLSGTHLKDKYQEFVSELKEAKKNIDEYLGELLKGGDITEEEGQMLMQIKVRAWLDKSEMSDWLKDRFVDEFKTRWNIDVSMGGDYEEAQDLLKTWYGSYSGEDMSDSHANIRKSYKQVRDSLKEIQSSTLKDMGDGLEVAYNYKGSDAKIKEAIGDANGYILKLKDMQSRVRDENIDLEAEWLKQQKGSGGSNKDALLELWKEKFDKLKKTYSEFKKWAELIGKDRAGAKLNELGLMDKDALSYFGLSEKDLKSNSNYEKAVKGFVDRIQGKLTTEARKKFSESVRVEWSGIDIDINSENIRKFTEKVKDELNESMKQYDVWKAWFDLTGNNTIAKNIALNITPVWDEKSKWMKDVFEKQAKAQGIKIDFGYDMTDEEAKNFFTGNKSSLLDFYKQVRDAFKNGGYEAAKEIAGAIKNTISTAEKIDAINAKYDKLKEQDKQTTGGLNGTILDEQRKKELQQYDDDYMRFFGAVTTMTKEQVQAVGDSIKNNLLKQLSSGVITIDEYSKGIKNVDDQMKKSVERFNSLSQAIAANKEGEWYKQNYENALYNQSQAADKYKSAQREKAYQQSLVGTKDYNADAYKKAVYDETDALIKLTVATDEADKALKALKGNEKSSRLNSEISRELTRVQAVTNAFGMLSNTLNSVSNDFEGLGDFVSTLNGATSGAKQGMSLATSMFGASAGPYGAAIGAGLSIISSMATKNDKANEEAIKDSKERTQIIKNLADTLEEKLSKTLGGIYNMTLDDATRSKLNEIQTKEQQKKMLGKWKDAGGNFYSSDTRDAAQYALENNSYYAAQKALLSAQIDELNDQIVKEQDKKKSDSNVVEDYRQQIAELKEELRTFSQDMAKAIYGIDFNSWATQLSDAIVGAWKNGENAVAAYKNAVSDMMTSTLSSVVSQKIIGTQLESLANEFFDEYEKSDGVLSTDGQKILAKMYALANDAVTATYDVLDEAEKYANEQGGTNKSWESSVGNAIQGVSEETADVLASYINGMRGDLNMQRISVESINAMLSSAEYGIEKQCMVATQQLTQLENIASNTQAMRTYLANLNILFNEVSNGTRQLHIS